MARAAKRTSIKKKVEWQIKLELLNLLKTEKKIFLDFSNSPDQPEAKNELAR